MLTIAKLLFFVFIIFPLCILVPPLGFFLVFLVGLVNWATRDTRKYKAAKKRLEQGKKHGEYEINAEDEMFHQMATVVLCQDLVQNKMSIFMDLVILCLMNEILCKPPQIRLAINFHSAHAF